MSNVFNDVVDGSEIKVSVASEYNTETSSWNYEVINFRRDFNPDMPDNTRPVYDRLSFKGSKRTRAENKIALTQEFQGFGTGLYDFTNSSGLLIKVEIEPEEGELPESVDSVMYYTNWCPGQANYSAPDEGEIELSLEGMFDEETSVEPDDTADWVNTTS